MARFLKNTDPRFYLVDLRSKAFLFGVGAVFLAVVGFAVWKQEWFRAARNFRMLAETSEGLQQGMAVRMSGFRIGKVEKITLEAPQRVRVDVAVFSAYAPYVRTDSVARVRGENLIGDRFIELSAGSDGAPEAPDGSTLEIGAEPTIGAMVEELKREFEPILAGLGQVAESLPQTVQRVDSVIEETRAMIALLRDDKGDLMQGFANFNQAVQQVDGLAAELKDPDKELMQGLDKFEDTTRLLSESIGPIIEKLDTAAAALETAATKAGELFGNADAVVVQLGEVVEQTGPKVPGMVDRGSQAVSKADDVITAVRGMWPIRRAVGRDDEQVLRTSSDD